MQEWFYNLIIICIGSTVLGLSIIVMFYLFLTITSFKLTQSVGSSILLITFPLIDLLRVSFSLDVFVLRLNAYVETPTFHKENIFEVNFT